MEVDGSSTTRNVVDDSAVLSDESSFYGDERTKADYDWRTTKLDLDHCWLSQQRSLQWIAEQNRAAAEAKPARSRRHHRLKGAQKMNHESGIEPSSNNHAVVVTDNEPMDIGPQPQQDPELHNPFEGNEMAKQLNEPLDDFLNRLRPSVTPVSSGPWIWIANPRYGRQSYGDVASLKQEGHRLLDNFASQRRNFEARNPSKHPGAITRMMRPAKGLLEEEIAKLARAKNLLNGKWMLFPDRSQVDEIWAKVARATDSGELGIGAKVATAGDDDRFGKSRLICVYTNDFSDIEDVKRVLRKLMELKLVGDDQNIFYKCDAYTYLDIMNGNEYKLKASMYNSKEMLKEV